jgi:pyruvate dehydrogenase E2 component (dihydrolipoamide acetyltransferase)
LATTHITLPNFGQTTAEGTLVAWLKREGDRVERGEALADVESDKTTVQVEAFVSGYLRQILRPAGSVVTAGEAIAVLTSSREEPIMAEMRAASDRKLERPQGVDTPRSPGPAPRVLATPAAKRLAQEHGLDLALLNGSGPGGRILEGDVRAYLENKQSVAEETSGDYRELSAARRAVAARMTRSAREAPQFTLSVDVDLTEVERQRLQAQPRPSYTAFVIKAVAEALRRHPQLNVAFENDRLRCHRAVHIGLAVATPNGLLAPVLRDADAKSVGELAAAIEALQEQARAGKLPQAAAGGATFSVSNLGMYGVDRFTALLNPPEAGILAVGRVAPRPVAVEGKVEVRPVATLTLTVDHRAADGAEAAQFLAAVRELLEKAGR